MKDYSINEEITAKEVRVLLDDGTQLGIMPIDNALDEASERNLDLVLISANANPPVCKIINFGKFQYAQMKKEKESKKNQKVTLEKTIGLSPNIDVNDITTKAKKAIELLQDGCKIKALIKIRGRQLSRPENSLKIMEQFWELVKDYAVMERKPEQEGKNMFMVLLPKKQ